MKRENKQLFFRTLLYVTAMIVLAFGLTLNTKSGLGVSPIISVAFGVSELTGLNFGDMTLVWYCVFVVGEIIIHLILKKDKKLLVMDVLQFPISLIVTRFINLFVGILPDFAVVYADSFLGSMPGRILILLAAIIITGIGAAVSLNMRMVPNPGDGIVQALADLFRKPVGLMKNIFDISCVTLTVLICLIFSGKILGVGIGTVIAMIGVGRVIAVWNHFTKAPIAKLTGMDE